MAVTLADLALDLRIIATPTDTLDAGQSAVLQRALAAAEALVAERAPTAPTALMDSATLAVAGYLYDRPSAHPGARFASAWVNSGAASMLASHVSRRARALGS